MSSGQNNGSKFGLNRFRRVSSHSSDSTFLNISDSLQNSRTRTVSSSSASMISTPSNNIRRIQQQRIQDNYKRSRDSSKKGLALIKGKGGIVKNKLLNLQSLKKYITGEDFEEEGGISAFGVKRKDAGGYDYSLFISYPGDNVDSQDEDYAPPAVKESQIKAWESAEKISKTVIFDSSDESLEEETQDDKSTDQEQLIRSIPGYTASELDVIQRRFDEQQVAGPSVKQFTDEEEKKLLWELRKKQRATQEQYYAQYLSANGKRKAQLAQKKDLLHKIFGYLNNVNVDYMTNNSSYSAFDSISSSQKAYREDKVEINQLLEEDQLYNEVLEGTRSHLSSLRNSKLTTESVKDKNLEFDDFSYDKYQDIISFKLDKIYDCTIMNLESFLKNDISSMNDFIDLSTDELYEFSLEYLRKRIKDGEELEEASLNN